MSCKSDIIIIRADIIQFEVLFFVRSLHIVHAITIRLKANLDLNFLCSLQLQSKSKLHLLDINLQLKVSCDSISCLLCFQANYGSNFKVDCCSPLWLHSALGLCSSSQKTLVEVELCHRNQLVCFQSYGFFKRIFILDLVGFKVFVLKT